MSAFNRVLPAIGAFAAGPAYRSTAASCAIEMTTEKGDAPTPCLAARGVSLL